MLDQTSTPDRFGAASKSRIALTVLGAALLLGVVGDVLLRPMPWGINMLLWIAALALGIVALALTGIPLRRRARFRPRRMIPAPTTKMGL